MTVRTRKRGKTDSYIFEAGKTDDGMRKVVEKIFMINWLEKVVALNGKPNSLHEYKFRFEHYILPKLGDEKFLFRPLLTKGTAKR